ncbi:hypothetical protein [Clostridium sp. UBA5119]|uniref:lysine 5,6-aminomutase reactivase subunit KamB n=1 Tax=Clostridium sp. UBA5119 TaxID=1946366 RepID=UPI0032175738
MNEILKLLKPYKSVSIIGMNKNVGKTTTLNHILKEARGSVSLGLTSIGRDGEELDRVTATEKPKIYIEKGTVIATAKQCLLNSDFTREIVRTTGINTPMGEVVICKALSDGYVDLGGPSVNSYMTNIKDQLLSLQCDLVIVDGALSRKTFASPAITEATVLSTGAALSRSMKTVISETKHTMDLLSLPHEQDRSILNVATKICDSGIIGIVYKDGTYKVLEVLTALEALKEIVEALSEQVSHVVIKGAVSDKLIKNIMTSTNLYKDITFLVEDGTKLFISSESLYRFHRQGGVIKVLNKITVVCITSNPKSPYGYEFPKDEFLKGLREAVNVPVFDVVGGK